MAVDFRIDDRDISRSIASYSITEDATPIDVTNMNGGVGQITLQTRGGVDARLAHRKQVVVRDSAHGFTSGRVSSVTDNGLGASVTADSRLVALVGERVAKPMTAPLPALFQYYLGLSGITSGIVIEPGVPSTTVRAPGWKGSVWDAIKRLCAAHRVEVSLVSDNIVLRPIRKVKAVTKRDSSISVSVDDSQIAQKIIVHYIDNVFSGTRLAYPLGGWNEDVQVFSVDAGEAIEYPVNLRADGEDGGASVSLESVEQPLCVDFVGRNVSNQSVYCVAGGDGKPITAAQWLATGGNLHVAIDEDTQSLKVTIVGSSLEEYGPYRIAATAGTGSYYSSLRVRGSGVYFNRKKIEMLTGNGPDIAPQEIGAEVENDYLQGYEAAWRAAGRALSAWTGPNVTIAATTRGINRIDDSGSTQVVRVDDFNALYAGSTVAGFNSTHAGATIDNLNEQLEALVLGEFENQAFGNIAGARVEEGSIWGRISTGTVTPAGVTYTAASDTLISDWNAHYASMTVAQFNALAEDWRRVSDMAIEPLIELS